MVTEWSRRSPDALQFVLKLQLYGYPFIELGGCRSLMLRYQVPVDVFTGVRDVGANGMFEGLELWLVRRFAATYARPTTSMFFTCFFVLPGW